MRRIKADTQWWHVYSRGARRLALFHEEKDNWKFIRILGTAVVASGSLLAGYVLMSNHYHLILKGTSEQITECLRRLNHTYSLYHNEKYGLSGHAFDGPYKAHLQPSPLLLLRKLAYVFLNPVAAGITHRPDDYRWSGYLSFMGKGGSPLPVNPEEILSHLDANPDRARWLFQEIVGQEARRPPRSSSHIPTAPEIHKREFEWLLEYARNNANYLKDENPTEVAACWGRRCGIPPKAIADVLGLPDTDPIYTLLRRCRARAGADPAFATLLTPP